LAEASDTGVYLQVGAYRWVGSGGTCSRKSGVQDQPSLRRNQVLMDSPAHWNRKLKAYCEPDTRRSVTQLVLSLSLFACVIALAHCAYTVNWALGTPFSIAAGTMIIKLFIIQHDCGHRAFFKSAKTCDLVGRGLSLFTFTPYEFWKRSHDKHHATSGDLDRRGNGDVDTLTVAEYCGLSLRGRIFYRIYRHPAFIFGLGPSWQFLLRYRMPIGLGTKQRNRAAASVIGHDLSLVLFFTVLCLTLGWKSVLVVWLPAVLVAATIGVWLFFIQHQHADTYWKRSGEWSFVDAALQGCSFYRLPRWLHWLTGNIGYHHIHHLCSRIPNYRLPTVFKEVPELQQAPSFGFWESFACARLALWCERRRRLVSFSDAAAASWA
jgi:omega-6 fatty acid desaturase (delta-12 desaturase)